ncbi:MAG: photosynthetic complex assembly protein PuhC [Burkholderiaceae bacterium]
MSHAHHDEIVIPRAILIAAGAMILVSLALVSTVRLLDLPTHEPDAPTVSSRELRFEDRADGGVDVIDARTKQVINVVQGESGFLRGTVRSLAFARKQDGHGSAQPFLLIARSDGRLTLQDPVTGKRIDLESFGPTNAGVFAALLNK